MKARMNRRGALRSVAALGATGAGVALAAGGLSVSQRTARATHAGPRTLHLEVDTKALNGVIFSRDGGVWQSGTPRQHGDHCNIAWQLFEVDRADGTPIGEWHCVGPWVGSTREKGKAGSAFLTTAMIELYGRGKLSGLVYCGMEHNDGTVTGGTSEFRGAHGSFEWGPVGNGVSRMKFDLLLPDLS